MADDKTKSERDAKDEKTEEKTNEETETKKSGDEKTDDERDAHIKKLNEEAKKHRLEAKAAKEKLEKFEKALGIASGKEKETVDPIIEERQRANDRLRRAILKAEVSNVARDAHDTNALFRILGDDLAEIEVDLDKERVDRPALEKKLAEVRKSHSWMFAGKTEDKKEEKTGKLPPDKGNGTSGESPFQTHRNLLDAGRKSEANEYYAKNRVQILATMPK